MDLDEEERSVQPLTKLLQRADNLVSGRSRQSSEHRRFRAEILDIQRTKDVVLPQAVCLETCRMELRDLANDI